MIRLTVQDASDFRAQPDEWLPVAAVRELVRASLTPYRGDGEVTLRLAGEDESRKMNRKWRGIDRPTNVLAFPADHATGEIGDIVICLPLVRSQAIDRGTTPAAHLAHLIVHGCLHLAGHDHGEPARARSMESLESELLTRAGWPDPWAAERA